MRKKLLIFNICFTTAVVIFFLATHAVFHFEKIPLQLYAIFLTLDLICINFFPVYYKDYLKEGRAIGGDRSSAKVLVMTGFMVIELIMVSGITLVASIIQAFGVPVPEAWVSSIIFFAWLKEELTGIEP